MKIESKFLGVNVSNYHYKLYARLRLALHVREMVSGTNLYIYISVIRFIYYQFNKEYLSDQINNLVSSLVAIINCSIY